MKKMVLILLLITIAVLPVAAKSTLINVGYNVQSDYWGIDGFKLRSLSLNITFLGGDTAGFYMQANPYIGLSFKDSSGAVGSVGDVYKFSESSESLFGSNFLLGFGGDINLGAFGILLGGGWFLDTNYYSFGNNALTVSTGAGLGANFYFQPGSGNLIINAGLNAAWHPWGFVEGDVTGDLSEMGMVTVNLNIGIGFRTGGNSSESSDW